MERTRKFVLKGKALEIAERLVKDKYRLESESQVLADKYGFRGCRFASTVKGGLEFVSFCGIVKLREPEEDFFIGDDEACFTPVISTEKGRVAKSEIDGVKEWDQSELFDHIGFISVAYNVEGVIYIEKSNQYFFYTSQDKDLFQGHPDLRELKLSEFYKMIGE